MISPGFGPLFCLGSVYEEALRELGCASYKWLLIQVARQNPTGLSLALLNQVQDVFVVLNASAEGDFQNSVPPKCLHRL